VKPLLFCIFLLAWGVAEAGDREPDGPVAPIFAANDIVDVTIRAPIDRIMKIRSLEEDTPGTFTYQDAESGEHVTLEVGIRTRGRFRHDRRNCSFAPLRLSFSKTKGTLLAKSKKLKLVTHCRTGSDRYEQVLLKEYLAYRILNTITDWSFRARLLRLRYEDIDNEAIIETYGILLEHRKQMATRIGMAVENSESTTIAALDGAYTNLVSVFQYLIGNTDFSPIKAAPGERCCHNHVLLKNDATQISVPYDFDMAGIVSAPYARPNARFKLRSVRQRLYRGRCANNEHLDTTLQTFRDQRETIYELVTGLDALSRAEKTTTSRYVDDFFKIIDEPRLVNREIVKDCLGP
jgi:hypothetical protein